MTTPNDSPAPAGVLPYETPSKYKYSVGTLKYTGFGLFMVFMWLLWGDFIWTLLDGAVPGILPLKLNELGAGDTVNQILNKSLAYTIVFMFAPAVSYRSDRTRSRWGRRIPYLLWSTPFVGLFLIGIGYYESLTRLITGGAASITFLGMAISSKAVTLMVFGALLIGWDFSNIFVNTVYWYLFNDVVPEQFLSRFLSLFRIVGGLAGIMYSKWIFPHSMEHFREIFVIAGIVYVVGFMAMCFFIREGEYPPPPETVDKKQGFMSSIKTFAKECFTHRFYWYFFLANTCTFLTGMIGTFGILRNTKSLGLTMAELGTMGFWTGWISLILQYPAGWVSDKYNPIRLYVITSIVGILGTLAACVWIFSDLGHHGNLVYMYVTSLIFMPIGAINGAAELPMYMRLLPRSRYGQFCSANAMIRAFAMIFGSVAAGLFMELLDSHTSLGVWHYTYMPLWTLAFQIPAAVFLLLLYREWQNLGGNDHYVPPGVDETPAAPQAQAQSNA